MQDHNDNKINAMLLTLIRLHFETTDPVSVYNSMGPAWRAEGRKRIREQISRGDAPSIAIFATKWRLKP
jgi:hypothetical protein